jgi:hypothetical protein
MTIRLAVTVSSCPERASPEIQNLTSGLNKSIPIPFTFKVLIPAASRHVRKTHKPDAKRGCRCTECLAKRDKGRVA